MRTPDGELRWRTIRTVQPVVVLLTPARTGCCSRIIGRAAQQKDTRQTRYPQVTGLNLVAAALFLDHNLSVGAWHLHDLDLLCSGLLDHDDVPEVGVSHQGG